MPELPEVETIRRQLAARAAGRTIVEGMDRRVPDATSAPTGPIPLGFLFTPLALVFLPLVLLLRRVRWLPWTVGASSVAAWLLSAGRHSTRSTASMCS